MLSLTMSFGKPVARNKKKTMNPMACRGLAPLALYGLKVLLTFGGIQIFLSVSSVLCIQNKKRK